VPYIGYALDLFRSWLQRFEDNALAAIAAAADGEGALAAPAPVADARKKKKKGKDTEAAVPAAELQWPVLLQLWRALLGALHKVFLYDHERTWAG